MHHQGLEIEEQIALRLQEILQRAPNARPVSLRRNMQIAGSRVDIDSVVEVGSRQYEILLEVTLDGSPASIRRVANRLKSLNRSFPDDANLCLAVGAQYISDEGMEVCKEEGIGCLDVAGNCYLSFGGIHVEIRGRKNLRPARKSIKSLFSPKSSRVVRVFLSEAGKSWQVQEIAEEAGISIGLVSTLKQRLLDEEFILEQDRRLRVRSPRRLIDAWVKNYRYKKNFLKEYYSLDSGENAEQSIADYCSRQNIACALGLFSAASRVAPHVRMNKVFIFVDANLDGVARGLNLKPVPSGSNVVLLKPFDAGVFYKSRDIDGLKVVSDVQTYIDLMTFKGRGEEAADFLMEHSLEPSWRENQTTVNAK